MATTALEITREDKVTRLLFMTVDNGDGIIHVDIFLADDEFMPVGTPSLGVSEHPNEEAYHKSLREQAHERDQFRPEFSTNPEWSPGYVEPEEQ